MSALPPKADMCGANTDVRYGPIADILLLDHLVGTGAKHSRALRVALTTLSLCSLNQVSTCRQSPELQRNSVELENPVSTPTEKRPPSCFALEEERGEDWKGSSAMKSEINETLPSL